MVIIAVAIPVSTIAILLQLHCNPIATAKIFRMKCGI